MCLRQDLLVRHCKRFLPLVGQTYPHSFHFCLYNIRFGRILLMYRARYIKTKCCHYYLCFRQKLNVKVNRKCIGHRNMCEGRELTCLGRKDICSTNGAYDDAKPAGLKVIKYTIFCDILVSSYIRHCGSDGFI